jgi:hypothetical protein
MPGFAGMHMVERVTLIDNYLKAHLPAEHRRHLGLKLGLTPEEYDRDDWRPEVPQMTLAVT